MARPLLVFRRGTAIPRWKWSAERTETAALFGPRRSV